MTKPAAPEDQLDLEGILGEMDRIAKLATLETRDLTAEEIGAYEALETRRDLKEKTLQLEKRNVAWMAPRVSLIPAAPKGDQALEHAFENYLRTGRPNADLADLETRDQTTGNTAGGYMIPPGFLVKITERLRNYGGIAKTAETITTATGQPLQWPNNDDTANSAAIQTEGSGAGSGGADLVFGTLTLGANMYNATGAGNNGLRVSVQLSQDAAFDVSSLVARKLSMRLGRKMALDLSNGTGSSQPKGLFYKVPDFNLPTGNAFTYAQLVAMVHSLDPDYRAGAVWITNDVCVSQIEQVVDTTGRPILMPFATSSASEDPGQAGSAEDGMGYTLGRMLLGYPVIIDQAVYSGLAPANATNKTANPTTIFLGDTGYGAALDGFVAFGNIRDAFIIRRVQDVTIFADPYGRAAQAEIQYFAWARMDANIQDPYAYSVMGGFHA